VSEVDGRHAAAAKLAKNLELPGRGGAKPADDLLPRICFLRLGSLSSRGERVVPEPCSGAAAWAEPIGEAEWAAAPFAAGKGSGRAAKGAKSIARPQHLAASAAWNTGRLRGTTSHAAGIWLGDFENGLGAKLQGGIAVRKIEERRLMPV
jgi:hypothetical protein